MKFVYDKESGNLVPKPDLDILVELLPIPTTSFDFIDDIEKMRQEIHDSFKPKK